MTEQQTPDREKKIAEIREALEKATPGLWKALDSCKGVLWKYVQTNNGVITNNIRWQDAELIANAPEWLGFLLNELERLEREYAEERAAHNAHVTELCELEQERDKLIECLRFYERLARGREINDGGRRARTLLSEIGVAGMCEKSWIQLREELKMLPRQMCVTPVAEALEYVDEILKLQEQLQSAQQEIERLRQERDKLIEVLRWYADAVNYEYLTSYLDQDAPIIDDNGQRARNILREIGVTVE